MDLQQMRMFVLSAKYLSFSRVAELCYTTQPSVSKSISALEAEIGEDLFNRSNRKISLTPFGERLLPYAERLLEQEDNLRGFIHQYQNHDDEFPLVVGVADMLLSSPHNTILVPLTNAAESFKQLHPNTDIKISACNEENMKSLIRTKRVDVGVVALDDKTFRRGISKEDNFLVLNESRNYLLYAPCFGTPDNVDELLNCLECLFTVSDRVAVNVTYDLLQKHDCPMPVRPCETWAEVILKVKNGQGAAILGEVTAGIAKTCGLNLMPLDDDQISSKLVAVWRNDGNTRNNDFANYLRNWFL